MNFQDDPELIAAHLEHTQAYKAYDKVWKTYAGDSFTARTKRAEAYKPVKAANDRIGKRLTELGEPHLRRKKEPERR